MTTEAVTVGQAAKQAMVPVEALRELCESGAVRAERRAGGHWYIEPQEIPSRERVGELLREAYRASVADAREAMARFMREVEAVQLDLQEAYEDKEGRGRLGNDLRNTWSANGPFTRSLHALNVRVMTVEISHRRLQDFYDVEDRRE